MISVFMPEARAADAAENDHHLVRVYEQKATCVVPGNIEYWICDDCGKIYADSGETIELSPEDVVTNQTGHKLTLIPAAEVSCDLDGNRAYYVCEYCGRLFEDGTGTVEITDSDSVTIPATGHKWGEWTVVREPGDNEDGEEQRVCQHDPSHIETRVIPSVNGDHPQGDINSDGSVDQRDVVRLMKYLTGADITVSVPALDINGDGEVDTKDLTHLLKVIADDEE